MRDASLKPRTKLLLLYLIERCGRNAASWPSVATIAAGTACSRRTVAYALAEAEAAGWLTRKRRRRATDIFEIHPPEAQSPALQEVQRPALLEPPEVQSAAPLNSQEVQVSVLKKCNFLRQGVQKAAHKSFMNLSRESPSSSFGISGTTTSATKTEDDIEKNEIEKLTDGKKIEAARGALGDHSGFACGSQLAEQVLGLCDGDLSLLNAYLEIAPKPRRSPGFYTKDVPRRLSDARRHLAEREAAERQAAAQPRVAPQPTPPPKACPTCDGTGYLMRWLSGSDAFEWCTCSAAERLRSQRPDLLERLAAESKQLHDAWRARATSTAEPRPALRLVARIASRGGGGAPVA
jgi:hypothetical protein